MFRWFLSGSGGCSRCLGWFVGCLVHAETGEEACL